jgi:hypothetical protein
MQVGHAIFGGLQAKILDWPNFQVQTFRPLAIEPSRSLSVNLPGSRAASLRSLTRRDPLRLMGNRKGIKVQIFMGLY